MKRFADILVQVIGVVLIIAGHFIAMLSVKVFASYVRRFSQPIFPEAVERYLAAGQQSKEGLIVGLGLVVIGFIVFFIRGRILRLRQHLTRLEQYRSTRK